MARLSAVRALVVLAALAGALAPLPAGMVESVYWGSLYPRLQPVVTGMSSLVPVALLDLAAGAAAIGGVIVLGRRMRPGRARQRGWAGGRAGVVRGLVHGASWLLVAAAVLYVWFLLAWGLNYRRVPLEQKLAYDRSRVIRSGAVELGRVAVAQVNGLVSASRPTPADDDALALAFAGVERALGARTNARLADPKRSVVTWYFRQAAIDGMTNPFFLEIILNGDLLSFERPFVLAHEWAHLAGYAPESEANFLAWLACVRGTPATRYSGWLAAYQLVAGQLPREDRQALAAALSPEVIADLDAASRRVARSSRRVRTAARGAYDTYLRANRIDEGIASYDAVVRLMLGTSFGPDWTPQLRR